MNKQLQDISKYAIENDMKVNYSKTKIMKFNPCKSLEFDVNMSMDGHTLENVEESKLLGIVVRSDLKWSSNTMNMIKKANKRLWLIRRLKNLGTCEADLLDIYTQQVRSLLEFAVPVWQSSLTASDKIDIERVQKSACHVILGSEYESYSKALETLCLETLETRRIKLCLNFALSCEKNEKFKSWFVPNLKRTNTRQKNSKYLEAWTNHARLENSPICYLIKLLNTYYK